MDLNENNSLFLLSKFFFETFFFTSWHPRYSITCLFEKSRVLALSITWFRDPKTRNQRRVPSSRSQWLRNYPIFVKSNKMLLLG